MDTVAAKGGREAGTAAISAAAALGLPETLSLAEGYGLLGVSEVHFLKLVERGYITRATRGRYVTTSVVQGYVRSLKESKKNTTRSASENRVRDARAREIEMRNAYRDHSIIDLDEAVAFVDELVGSFRAELSGLPSRFTRDREMRARLEIETNGAIERIHKRYLEAANALRESGTLDAGDASATA